MTEAVIRETSPLICRANQWTGFFMITASIIKELKVSFCITLKKKTFIFVCDAICDLVSFVQFKKREKYP